MYVGAVSIRHAEPQRNRPAGLRPIPAGPVTLSSLSALRLLPPLFFLASSSPPTLACLLLLPLPLHFFSFFLFSS